METVVNAESAEDFQRMVEQYQAGLLRTCYVMLRDYALAEDAVQETFLKAYQAWDAFRGECAEKTWLMRIAMNTCRDMKRRAWFRWVDRCVTPETLPEAAVPFEERDDSVIRAVMRLSRREREVVLLYFYQDMTLEEVGRALGLSKSTAFNRLKLGKERLKGMLEGGADDE